MIETLHSYSYHTFLGLITEGIPAILNSLNAVINSIAKTILIQVVISVPLFYLHHNLFVLGFTVGFVFDSQVRQLVEKVNIVYSVHRTLVEKVIFFGGGGFLAVLTMPTSLIIATLYYSAQWGTLLYQNSFARFNQTPAPKLEVLVPETKVTSSEA